MEQENTPQPQQQPSRRGMRGNTWAGLLFVLVGGILLMRQMGYPFPPWLFSWEMILITLGIFIGIRHRFRDFSWLVLVLIGVVFLSDNIWPGFRLSHYAVPIIIITLGLLFLLAPKSMCHRHHLRHRHRLRRAMNRRQQHFREHRRFEETAFSRDAEITSDSTLDIVSIFAGIKKKVLSKQFTGGEIVCVFGGAEINLSNADFNSNIELELVQIFGGTKLIVPANWEVRSELAAIFGGVDDKRRPSVATVPEKIVVLKGTVIFGGVEVNSF